MSSRTRSPRRAESASPVGRQGATTIVAQLHLWLAITSALVLSFIGLEAGWRAWRRSPPGVWAGRLEALLLLVLVVAIAGGLGLVVGGGQPRELLHFIYAVVALSVVPVADSLSRRAGPRARGFTSLAAAMIVLAIVARLFQTG